MAGIEKAAIAAVAASLVCDGDVIAIGAGSTTQALARRLARHRELTIMTNSLLVAQVLARSNGVDVVMTGGNLRGSIFALVGNGAEQSLSNMRTRRVFLSGNGLSPERGLSTPSPLVAGVDRAIVATAEEVVVLADHTKLGVEAMVQTVAAERITHLVTNDQAPADLLARFRARGVTVHVAQGPMDDPDDDDHK